MATFSIRHQRLHNQHLASARFDQPHEIVEWLGAVQAQDYLGALWAVGLRTCNSTEAIVEKALAERKIVRTWPMRRTLHFVAVADVRWMLKLLTPRMISGMSRQMKRHFGLDEAAFARSRKLLVRALEGGRQLARPALYEVLERGGVATDKGRGLHILSHLAQDGVLCFGARAGKQQTFALLDEWVPASRTLEREEALAELAKRYFTSHGPATLQDFAWWSGLSATDTREALELARPNLEQKVLAENVYWFVPSPPIAKKVASASYLLPPFDEYTVAYKDRSAALDPEHAKRPDAGNGIFYPTLVVDGQVLGTWKRTPKKDAVVITPNHFAKLGKLYTHALADAAARYGKFLGVPVVWAKSE